MSYQRERPDKGMQPTKIRRPLIENLDGCGGVSRRLPHGVRRPEAGGLM
jgi:hypothetical protein